MQHYRSKIFLLFFAIFLLTFNSMITVFANETSDRIGTWKEVSPIPFKSSLPDDSLSITNVALAGDHKVLVIANGTDAYVYELANDLWKQVNNRTMKNGQVAGTLSDGRVFLIGGGLLQDSDDDSNICTEIFNPADNRFVATAPLPESMVEVSAVLLQDGTVLLFGKNLRDERIAYVYNVARNCWWKKGTVPYAGTKTLINSLGNVFSYSPSVLGASLAPGEYYDFSKDEFFTSWVMPNPRTSGAVTVLADDKFMIVGGSLGGNSAEANWDAEIFDPQTNMWRTTSFMSRGRDNARAVTLPDGRVMVIAGLSGREYFKTTEVYQPITDTWTKGPSLKYTYSRPFVLQLKNGNVMIFGGYDGKESNRCEMLVLDTALVGKALQSYEKLENAVLATVGSPYLKVRGNRVLLNEKDSTVTPITKDNQTLVPINFFKIGFNAAIVEDADGKVTIGLGQKQVVPAHTEKINGTIYVPLRPVAEALGKKITWLKGLIAVADQTVYMDVLSADIELTALNPSHLLGIGVHGKIVKEVPVLSKDGWDYKWVYMRHENAVAYYTDGGDNVEYSNLYLIRENKAEGSLQQVYEGISGKILKIEDDGIYFFDFGYLSKIKPGEPYREFVKNTEALSLSENMSMAWYPYSWEAGNLIPISNGKLDGDWIYFTWDPIGHLNTRRDDPLGYPMRVKVDGSGLQILSQYQMAPNRRGIEGFTQKGDYLYYITNRKLLGGVQEQFTLHRLKTDGSDEIDIAEVMDFYFYQDKIYYMNLDETGDYSSAKFYSINLDGSGNKLLSKDGAWEVKFYGDHLYYRIYNDRDGLYTMKTDGSGIRKIGDVQGDLLYADDQYVYFDYQYFDWNGGGVKNLGKYKINVMTGQKEKAQ